MSRGKFACLTIFDKMADGDCQKIAHVAVYVAGLIWQVAICDDITIKPGILDQVHLKP